jgi:hypothetical protein
LAFRFSLTSTPRRASRRRTITASRGRSTDRRRNTPTTEWERTDNRSDADKATLKPTKKYRLAAGHAGIYQDGAIHSIDYPEGARFIRVTGTNLDRIERDAFDLETGKIKRMSAQQAT